MQRRRGPVRALVTAGIALSVLSSVAGAQSVFLDYDFPGGTPANVVRIEDNHFRVAPNASNSGAQWFMLTVRVNNLEAGKEVRLEIGWPPVWSASDLKPGMTTEQIDRATKLDSFLKVVPKILFVSTDFRRWTRAAEMPGASVSEAEGDRMTVRLRGTGRPLYVSTQIPYTFEGYTELLRIVREREPQALKRIGLTRAGLPQYAVTLNATSSRPGQHPTVYIQAYQHSTEYGTPLLADAMIRFLLEDPDGRKLREKVSFHIVPAVHVDALFYGMPYILSQKDSVGGRPGNPNRDWAERRWVELQNVDSFVRANVAAGHRYVMGFDLHNGWHLATNSGATYTLSGNSPRKEWPAERYEREQKRFIDFMYARTDHQEPGRYWVHDVEGLFRTYFHELTGALSYTIEFSRHMWWNRRAGRYEPYSQEHPTRFAREALTAMTQYLAQNAGGMEARPGR